LIASFLPFTPLIRKRIIRFFFLDWCFSVFPFPMCAPQITPWPTGKWFPMPLLHFFFFPVVEDTLFLRPNVFPFCEATTFSARPGLKSNFCPRWFYFLFFFIGSTPCLWSSRPVISVGHLKQSTQARFHFPPPPSAPWFFPVHFPSCPALTPFAFRRVFFFLVFRGKGFLFSPPFSLVASFFGQCSSSRRSRSCLFCTAVALILSWSVRGVRAACARLAV